MKNKIHFPKDRNIDSITKDFIRRLLDKDPENRLGHPINGGAYGIRDHQFFEDTNWFETYLKQVRRQKS